MSFIHKLSDWYFSKKAFPYWGILLLDSFILFMAYIAVYFMFRPPILSWASMGYAYELPHLAGWLVIRILCVLVFYLIGMRVFHTYMGIIRYSSFIDLLRVAGAMLLGGFLVWLAHYPAFNIYPFEIVGEAQFEANIRTRDIIAATTIAIFLMWLLRMIVKFLYDSMFASDRAKPVFIYGIKEGGIGLAKSIRNEKPTRFKLKGFISDPGEIGSKLVMGKKVWQLDDNVVKAMKSAGVKALLVSPLKMDDFRKNSKFQNALLDAGIKMYISPRAKEFKAGTDTTPQLQEVKIEDLLAREEIKVDLEAVGKMLSGRRILITGSAGSIGSEIVRQVASFSPAAMMLIDQAETPQHDIRLMMKKDFPNIPAATVVTSICNAERMEEIFREFKPDYVFHAAAYKHVPMMEDNPSESVKNNIYGTRVIADLSVKYGVKKFVMISTDKAVNPTNVMGCSKRICEIYVQSLDKAIKEGKIEGQTQFVTTRFGNVLGSNGSVIPLFKKQIQAGGPVTVTHPDIIRYFMLIPEACKLVLEAGTMGNGGEIFVFDMGEPVKIADLAKRMIQLSGAKNVDIIYTGLRDGEKLYEEVLNDEETSKPTFHEKIKIAGVREYEYDAVCNDLDELQQTSLNFDNMQTVKKMKEIVPEFKSKHSIYEQLDSKNQE